MLIIEQNLDIWYREYRKQFDKSTKYAKSRHGATRGLSPLSRTEFKYDFISTVNDNPKLSGKQIAQKMAKEEVFPQTYKQAIKHAEAHVQEFGGNVTIALINKYRIQSEDRIFDIMAARRQQLKAEGYRATDIAMIISQEFYGSD